LNTIKEAVDAALPAQDDAEATWRVLAGHNRSGKSTMWRRLPADRLEMPDHCRSMMLSIFPEPGEEGHLVSWVARVRDRDIGWMRVAQQGVQAFAGHAMAERAPFVMEAVFSHWEKQGDGRIASKIDLIRYCRWRAISSYWSFIGLRSASASVARVDTRVLEGGHGINEETLRLRFPKTQTAIASAIKVADASILADNSRTPAEAFTVCRVQVGLTPLFDIRRSAEHPPAVITAWLEVVAPD
jgi:predicted ABC-type ATPase